MQKEIPINKQHELLDLLIDIILELEEYGYKEMGAIVDNSEWVLKKNRK